jgi:hypothetical protein
MTFRKRLEKFVQGWLPKEPSLPNHQEAIDSKNFKTRMFRAVDSYWAKSKTFRLILLATFFLILIASAIIVALFFRPYPFLFFAISAIIGIVAYWKRPRKQAPPRGEIMNSKKRVENSVRGWLPKEPNLLGNEGKVADAKNKVNWVALKIILVLLGVFVGWTAASYAFMYFIGHGVASDYATDYSIILWLAFFGVFGLVAFKVKRRK